MAAQSGQSGNPRLDQAKLYINFNSAQCRLNEAFGLSVGLRSVRPGEDLTEAKALAAARERQAPRRRPRAVSGVAGGAFCR